ncbi:periplasmic binding protein-like II [Neocallimastix californiae]|uniref:Periplasmic binding protein-like II n=1 Tax=Neocallimastix californiae TaxID=1754190 RepID=A0A1Y2DPF2_9FUNG|nr:periplasmic binding protein-like II [Neocallimastix californiae]|eukprot:ORY61097.1 periplasmic binding protein-like II [Neocallimastix californiae]
MKILQYLCYFSSNIGKAIDICVLANSKTDEDFSYKLLINKFNEYSIENNLNITLSLNLISKENSTLTDYELAIESLLLKKSKKYDLLYFDNTYTTTLGRYFLNLEDYIPIEHINNYKDGIALQTCYYDNHLIGLPITIDFTVLYYNEKLLQKYNKNYPRTWDELIETARYIVQKEKEANNTLLIGYNGMMSDSETGTCSLYEFIYTFRDTINSSFPDLQSQNTKNALTKLKQIKEELSSDEIFKSNNAFTFRNIGKKHILFGKNWYTPVLYEDYKKDILPGSKNGISGSVLGGYNLSINKYICEEKRNAAIIAFKFLTTKEIQKSFMLESKQYSPITSFYDDEKVCEVIDCSLYKRLQLIQRPYSADYGTWSSKFRNKIYKYLYDSSISLSNVLKEADKITSEYSNSANSKKTFYRLFIIIFLFSIFSTFILI